MSASIVDLLQMSAIVADLRYDHNGAPMPQADGKPSRFAQNPPTLSRRSLLVGIATLPGLTPPPMAPVTDPVIVFWNEWQRAAAEADALCGRWSEAEQALARCIGWNAVEATVATKAAEAQGMADIAQHQDDLDRLLDDLGRRILALPSQGVAGTIAKLSLALTVADPTQLEELEWRLVKEALHELRSSAPH